MKEKLSDCKYCLEEICVNADCPLCADFCPLTSIPDVCKWEKREAITNSKQDKEP